MENPAQRNNKQSKHVPVKPHAKTPALPVYITLDMFEQGQGRWNQNKLLKNQGSQLWNGNVCDIILFQRK